MNVGCTRVMCLELRLKEAEGCCGWHLLSATSRPWKKMDIVKRKKRESTTMEDGDVGIRLLILSGEVFDSGKNLFVSGPDWSGAGAFEVYLWAGRTLLVEFELLGGGGSEPAVEVDEDDSITTGNAVVQGLE